MKAARSTSRRRIGCLLLSIGPIALALLAYQIAYYNPMRLANARDLGNALNEGLLVECVALLSSTNADFYRPARVQWPSAIKTLHPRGVFVYSRKPQVVYIELWKNYREWERNSILGIWPEKGGCGVSLIVYATDPAEDLPERGNSQSSVPYFMRKVADKVYLQYPKWMESRVVRHTDLIRPEGSSTDKTPKHEK